MAGKRSIFEEVSTDEKIVVQPGAIDRAKNSGARGGIRIWLTILFALVVVMIAVGGLTRLTDSGLSITEWAPVTGAVPPMSEAAWLVEFEKYKAIPEYQLQNKGMALSEFKVIYWWEWGHRQLGRVIGLVWAAGFLWFLLRKQIPTGWTGRLLLLGGLGGLQGAIGWWMVASGVTQGEGVLDADAAADVLDDAVVRTSAAGNQLVVHRGYSSAFEALEAALTDSGRLVRTRDDSVGRIAFSDGGPDADGAPSLVLTVEPVNVAAVRVGVVDTDGRRLDATRERAVLELLAERLLEAAGRRSV